MPKLWKWPLHRQIFLALGLAVLVGVALLAGAKLGWTYGGFQFVLKIVSDIFLNLLKMIILPLVVTSIFMGVTSISSFKTLGKIGARTGLYYLCSSALAIFVGLLFVNILKPGVGSDLVISSQNVQQNLTENSLWSLLTRAIPQNPFESLAKFDMLGVIVFVILFSIFSVRVGGAHLDRLRGVAESIYEVTMKLTQSILALAPIGIFALVLSLILTTGFSAFFPLMKYLLCVGVALCTHFFIVLPLAYWYFTKKSPLTYLKAMSPALLTAFSSASSSATLPLTLECAEERGGVSNRVASLVIPLGATVNMDGTALYEGVAVLFIAQVMGVDLSIAQQGIVLITALMVSVGAAGIPHAGLVMMVIILEAVGLPIEATGLIWGVDRVVDMARTATNVWSDSVGAAIIDQTV
ncbi:MAG: dicarboxylate/amino acid:cation symporter [Bdellovibrionales bacterium CG10_big_fil_rev_8_21_14_0_10_45_34]|nr:MAG: dicarboxylate/amino acid:cation symporter [Bdellovibrionales bacterium CG10_big_fil_rev_8_21_14_0_10_45_34]